MRKVLYRSRILVYIVIYFVNLTSGQAEDYVGCHISFSRAHVHYDSDLSPSSCISYCLDLNFAYAGLSYLRSGLYFYPYCTCADSLSGATLTSDANCRLFCPEDFTQYCGGYGVDRVFYTIPPTTKATTSSPPSTTFLTTTNQEAQTTVTPTTFKGDIFTSESSVTDEITTYYEKSTEIPSSMMPTINTIEMTSESQRGPEIWYISGAIVIVFIACLLIVFLGIRNNGRNKSKQNETLPLPSIDLERITTPPVENVYVPDATEIPQSPIYDSPDSGDSGEEPEGFHTQPAENLYVPDATVVPMSPIYDAPDSGEEPETLYAELSETPSRNEQLPDAMYYTVHRPESTTEDERDYYGNNRNGFRGETIHEEDQDEIPTVFDDIDVNEKQTNVRCSQISSVGSVDNPIYEESTLATLDDEAQRPSFRSSQNSSVKSVKNVTYTSNQQLPTTCKPSHTSSVGSVENVIYESGSSSGWHEEVEVFSPSPSETSFEGTVVNVIYEAADMER